MINKISTGYQASNTSFGLLFKDDKAHKKWKKYTDYFDPDISKRAMDIADTIESDLADGKSFEDSYDKVSKKYNINLNYTLDNAIVMLVSTWKHAIDLVMLLNNKYNVPALNLLQAAHFLDKNADN